MTDPQTEPSSDASNSLGRLELESSFGSRILSLLIPVLMVGAVGGGIYWGLQALLDRGTDTLHPVSGQAFIDGEPIEGAAVFTKHVDGNLGGIAVVDAEGNFEFRTNGEPGIYSGDHIITLALTNGGFPPLSMIPDKYTKTEETPFRISVNGPDATLKLELFGRIDVPMPDPGGMNRPGGGPPSSSGGPPPGNPAADADPQTSSTNNESGESETETDQQESSDEPQ